MTAANHFENLPVDQDSLEFESSKYLYHPILFVKLRSGNIAVASGLGGRTLREIVDPSTEEGKERFFSILLAAATSRTSSAAEERIRPSALLDLDDFTIDEMFSNDALNIKDLKL